MKPREMKTKWSEDKVAKMIEKRQHNGQYYKCEEFPEDPEENYYWVREGGVYQKENRVSESISAAGSVDMDPEMAAAILGQDGILEAACGDKCFNQQQP